MILKHFLNWLRSLRIRYNGSPEKLKEAIRKADRLHLKTNRRYRVYFLSGRYQVMTRGEVQRKKCSGEWARTVNMTRMVPMEFYDTEAPTGSPSRGVK